MDFVNSDPTLSASDSEEADYDSASEGVASDAFEDDGSLGDLLDRNDLEDVESSTTVQLGIETKYQPSWKGDEAFREFYQNWLAYVWCNAWTKLIFA